MTKLLVSIINFYQLFSSSFVFCKHEVSCSEFTKRSILEKGVLRGGALGLKRILTCI